MIQWTCCQVNNNFAPLSGKPIKLWAQKNHDWPNFYCSISKIIYKVFKKWVGCLLNHVPKKPWLVYKLFGMISNQNLKYFSSAHGAMIGDLFYNIFLKDFFFLNSKVGRKLLAHGLNKFWLVEFIFIFIYFFKRWVKKIVSPRAPKNMFGQIFFTVLLHMVILLVEMKNMKKVKKE